MKDQFPIEVTEQRTVRRITIKQSITDFLDAFNVERGLIYTLKLLFTKPGMLIRYYLKEGRFKIVNAFRLLIITTALSLVLLSVTDSFEVLFEPQGESAEASEMSKLVNTLYTDWYNLMLWLSIPSYALFNYILFRKYERFNYAEHLVIQSFIVSVSNILVIIFLPLGYVVGFQVALLISFLLSFVYFLLAFIDLFKTRSFGFFVRGIMAYILGNFLYYLVFGAALATGMFDLLVDK